MSAKQWRMSPTPVLAGDLGLQVLLADDFGDALGDLADRVRHAAPMLNTSPGGSAVSRARRQARAMS
jgi:hypothetical protein